MEYVIPILNYILVQFIVFAWIYLSFTKWKESQKSNDTE